MINFRIELGDGDVGVGITRLKIREGVIQFGLCFKDLVHAEEIGTSIKDQETKNLVAITVKNKESYLVLKNAVDKLGLLLEEKVDFDKLAKDYEGIVNVLEDELEKEVTKEKNHEKRI